MALHPPSSLSAQSAVSIGMEYVPPASQLLPAEPFEALIASIGNRVSWMRSHSCPCAFAPFGPNGRLATPGSPQPSCKRCFGIGFYWDPPGIPFQGLISFIHTSQSPDEPGQFQNTDFGVAQVSEPTLTIPFRNPNLAIGDLRQPTDAWNNASANDLFVSVDIIERYTAMLQVGGLTNLPYQQNLQIAPMGAVTVWNPDTQEVDTAASYTVSGATITLNGYDEGTSYMVEFQASLLYVAFRRAGGLPHVRPLGGGTINEPRRFRLQTLDFWTRQRGIQPLAPGTSFANGLAAATAVGVGEVVLK